MCLRPIPAQLGPHATLGRFVTSYVDGLYWQAFFDVLNDLVCCGHMSGLLVRGYARWPWWCPIALVPIIAASLIARDVWRVVRGFRRWPYRSSHLSACQTL